MSTPLVRILLVDDDEVDRMAFLRHVQTESLPYACRTAGSVAETKRISPKEEFDVVILDNNLTDGLGLDLLPQFGQVPVIFLTGSEEPEDAVRAMKSGAVDYLLKDHERKYLKLVPVAVDRALQHQRAKAELQESQELFRQSFNEAPIGKAFISPNGQFLRVNRVLCELFGHSESEFLADGARLMFETVSGPGCMEKLFPTLTEGVHTCQLERRCHHKKGGEIWIQLDIALVPDSRGLAPTYISQVQDISARKGAEAALEEAHAELVETSRLAGMAEVATGVLHNVGNVLNSVNIASTMIAESLQKSKAANLPRLVAVLREHEQDLGAFLTTDPQGKRVLGFLTVLSEHLIHEQEATFRELTQLRNNIEHIKQIVKAQQSSSKIIGHREALKVADLIDDVLRMDLATRLHVRVVTECDEGLTVISEKHKVLQILINLMRNSRQACEGSPADVKTLTIRAAAVRGHVCIGVSDNGIGISPENLARIFSHGFTTKKDGHGFGLHSCLIVAKELGGELHVHSDGVGKGATFTLKLPVLPVSLNQDQVLSS